MKFFLLVYLSATLDVYVGGAFEHAAECKAAAAILQPQAPEGGRFFCPLVTLGDA